MSKPEVIRSPTFNTFKLHLIENLTRYHNICSKCGRLVYSVLIFPHSSTLNNLQVETPTFDVLLQYFARTDMILPLFTTIDQSHSPPRHTPASLDIITGLFYMVLTS